MSSSFLENLQKKSFLPTKPSKDDLPISQINTQKDEVSQMIKLRRRISTSFSVSVQPLTTTSNSVWGFRKSRSMHSLGESTSGPLRRWWEWSWGWILSRKPKFAEDIEMNEEETVMLGCHSRGTWRHVFYKVRSEIRKLVRSQTLPTTQYDSFSYAQNFDDGKN